MAFEFQVQDPEAQRIYEAADVCIYCNRSEAEAGDLKKEHVFPLGLGGKHVLPKASCLRCAALTGSLEGKLLRGPLWPVRVRLGIHSGRRPGEQPTDFDVEFCIKEQIKKLRLPIADIPVSITLPILEPSAISTGRPWAKDGSYKACTVISFDEGFILDSFAKATVKAFADAISLGQAIHPILWMRLIAKILHGYAFANCKIFTPYLQNIILGKDDEMAAYYVGASSVEIPTDGLRSSRSWVGLSLGAMGDKKVIIGFVSVLLPYIKMPFMAVIGELNG